MSAPPYMKLYVAEWTADTQALTCEQDGAYGRLVRAMWRAGGTLPNDPVKLARIVGLTEKRWAEIGGDVVSLFLKRGNFLSHKRLRNEVKKYEETVAKRRQAGKTGGVQSGVNRRKKKANPSEANASILLPKNEAIADITRTRTRRNKNSAPTEQRVLIPAGVAVACLEGATPPPAITAEHRAEMAAAMKELAAGLGSSRRAN